MTLMDIIKKNEISPLQLAQKLDISVTQVYTWNRKGISKHNPHFYKLKEILPEVQPKEELLKKNGEEDGRYRCGRKRKQLSLSETDLSESQETEFESTLFPKIHMNRKPR